MRQTLGALHPLNTPMPPYVLWCACFSSLVTAAGSWPNSLPLSQPGREKTSFSTMVGWAWTNQVTDCQALTAYAWDSNHIPADYCSSKGKHKLFGLCQSEPTHGLAGESTHLRVMEEGLRGRRWATVRKNWWMRTGKQPVNINCSISLYKELSLLEL